MARSQAGGHRAGVFKQTNKTHKTGRHRSKGEIAVEKKGRTGPGAGQSGKRKRELSRVGRRHQSQQIRAAKKDAVLASKRSLGGADSPPFLTAIVSLTEDVVPELVAAVLGDCGAEEAVGATSPRGLAHLSLGRFRARFSFLCPHHGNLFAILDALKAADSAILVWPVDGVLSEAAELLLSTLYSAGLPAVVSVVRGLKELGGGSAGGKKVEAAKRNLKELLAHWSLEAKFTALDSPADALNLLRQLGGLKRKPNVQRERRAHLVAEEASGDAATGTVSLCGYVRGPPLDVNGLVHLPGWGDFQLAQIDLLPDPHPLLLNPAKRRETEAEEKVLERADPATATPLDSEVAPDALEGEQTWPTEDELKEAKEEARERKRVPKGTSEYQAAWILDSDEEGGEDEDEESDEDMEPESEEEEEEEGPDLDDNMSEAASSVVAGAEKYDAALDLDEERRLAVRFREERENQLFPDEIDTPLDAPARVRFQRYRGLKSFRSSPWDKKENLPADYARIFQFANFRATKKRVLKEDTQGAMNGWYVRLHLKNASSELIEHVNGQKTAPLVAVSLLRHEAKMSVVNVVLRRHAGYSGPVKSKDPLVFHVAHRRFTAQPVFSAHTTGAKHKFERWLPGHGSAAVASFYAPISFPPAAVLAFAPLKEDGTGGELVATGGLLDLNPNRIILKRLVLSGHPFKINARSAVVRHMFFNREDVLWFKPVELRTKCGRRGHIKEVLGTHGHMKCIFDGQLNSMDTILLNLYKRVFPKWTYAPYAGALPPPAAHPADALSDQEEEMEDD